MSYLNLDDVESQLEAFGLVLSSARRIVSGASAGSVYVETSKSVRCNLDDVKKKGIGWYWLHEFRMDDGLYLVGSYGAFEGADTSPFKIELTKTCDQCKAQIGLKDKECPSCGCKKATRHALTAEQIAAHKKRQAENKRRVEAEVMATADRAAGWAEAVWAGCREVRSAGDHDYLTRKQLASAYGARILDGNDGIMLGTPPGIHPADRPDETPEEETKRAYQYLAQLRGALVVPMCDLKGRRRALQFILSREKHGELIKRMERDKTYWPQGMVNDGLFFLIGGAMHGAGIIAEGYATAGTLHEAGRVPVAVAFDAGHMGAVGEAIWKASKKRVRLLYAADDDWLQRCKECKAYTTVETDLCTHCGKLHGKMNAGVARSSEAALATSGAWLKPVFAQARPADKKGPTDFNDLRCLEGLAPVSLQVGAKLTEMGAIASDNRGKSASGGAGGQPPHSGGDSPERGGGGGSHGDGRGDAVSILTLDEAVERFIFIDDDTGEFVFDTRTRNVCKRTKLLKMLAAGVRDDDVKDHPRWRQRAVFIDQIGFDPGGADQNIICNRWAGWPTVPKAGKCEVILDLLRFLCSGEKNSDELYLWVLKWLAYPIQHPGAKMHSAVVVHGPQGTGKSRFFEVVAKIYGDYSIVLTQGAIEDKFNADWSERKLFVLADEVVANTEKYHLKNQLKNFITSEWVRVNPKNVAAHREANHMNIVFLSNEIQPVVLENDDRRHCVIYTPPKLADDFYADLTAEIDNGGIAALHDFLLTLDLGDFKFFTKPPMTEAKKRLISVGANSDEHFINEWRAGHLDIPFCPIGKSTLFAEYMSWCRRENELHARTSKFFWAQIERMGWYVGVTDRASDLGPVAWRCCIPDDSALHFNASRGDDDFRRVDGELRSEWLRRCYDATEEALSRRGNQGGRGSYG